MIKCIVPVSGGKDSQACLKLAMQTFDKSEIIGLFCDTKFEHPLTYKHIENIRNNYGVEIRVVNAGDVLSKSVKYGRFPGGGARHCTDELKIKPTKEFLTLLANELGHGFEVWYGMRSAESAARETRYSGKVCDELYQPHEVMPSKYPQYMGKKGIMFRLAILHWTTAEVMEYLNGEHNPLYDEGFDRVGCFPCLASGDKWKEKAFNHDDFGREQHRKVIVISRQIKKSIWTTPSVEYRNRKNDKEVFEGCAICSI